MFFSRMFYYIIFVFSIISPKVVFSQICENTFLPKTKSSHSININTHKVYISQDRQLLRSIESLNFPEYIERRMVATGINYVVDLVMHTKQELYRQFPGFGNKVFTEIYNVLSEMNLYLGMDIQWPLKGKRDDKPTSEEIELLKSPIDDLPLSAFYSTRPF